MQPENTPTEKFAAISSELRVLEEIIVKLRQLEVDATEYACLKGIVVFKTGEWSETYEYSLAIWIYQYVCYGYKVLEMTSNWLNNFITSHFEKQVVCSSVRPVSFLNIKLLWNHRI